MVPAQDGALQERERPELPPELEGRPRLLRAHPPPPTRPTRLLQALQGGGETKDHSVVDPDPDWKRIQRGRWIRIRIRIRSPDPGGEKMTQKHRKKVNKYQFFGVLDVLF